MHFDCCFSSYNGQAASSFFLFSEIREKGGVALVYFKKK